MGKFEMLSGSVHPFGGAASVRLLLSSSADPLLYASINLTALPDDRLHIEKDLLRRLAAGEEAALAELFSQYSNRLYSVACKLTHCTVTSEEIVQDVFLNIWRSRAALTKVKHLESYLFVVTRNVSYKALRKIALRRCTITLPEHELQFTATPVQPLLPEKELETLLRTAVERLPPQQRKVYRYIREQGLKREEVANLLQLQPETVKFHLSQAMKNIRSFCLPRLNSLLSVLLLLLNAVPGK